MQGSYLKFDRPVRSSDILDRVYMNLKPDLKKSIKRREFNDLNKLALFASEVERMIHSLVVERTPLTPENSFFLYLPILENQLLNQVINHPLMSPTQC